MKETSSIWVLASDSRTRVGMFENKNACNEKNNTIIVCVHNTIASAVVSSRKANEEKKLKSLSFVCEFMFSQWQDARRFNRNSKL
jgi:hypothetical protein